MSVIADQWDGSKDVGRVVVTTYTKILVQLFEFREIFENSLEAFCVVSSLFSSVGCCGCLCVGAGFGCLWCHS